MVVLLGAFLLKQSKCSVMKMTALLWNVLAKILKNTSRRTATAAISKNMRKAALYSQLPMWEIVTAQRKVIRIQICLWMNLLILRNKQFVIFLWPICTVPCSS